MPYLLASAKLCVYAGVYIGVCIQYNVHNCGNFFHELETDDKNTKHTLIEGVNEG